MNILTNGQAVSTVRYVTTSPAKESLCLHELTQTDRRGTRVLLPYSS